MIYYSLATGIAVFLAWILRLPSEQNIKDGKSRSRAAACYCIVMLPLLLLSAFRWNVGTDTWHTYTPEYLAMKSEITGLSEDEEQIMLQCWKIYSRSALQYTGEQVQEQTLADAKEFFTRTYKHTAVGFQAIERALIFLNADVQWLYTVSSVIIFTFISAAIYSQSNNPVLAVLMFVITGSYFLSLNIVSQFMAISICLFACSFAEKRKPLLFFLFVSLAACFHISAFVFLPWYFLPKLKIRPLWCAAAVALMFVLAPVGFPLLKEVVSVVAPQYTRYFNREAEFEWIFFALGLAVFAVGSYYYQNGENKPYFKLWYYLNVLGLLVLCFSGQIPFLKRINHYFAAPHFLFLPMIVECENDRLRRIILCTLIIILFIAETVVSVGYMNKNGVLPYQTFFQGDRLQPLSELLVSMGVTG